MRLDEAVMALQKAKALAEAASPALYPRALRKDSTATSTKPLQTSRRRWVTSLPRTPTADDEATAFYRRRRPAFLPGPFLVPFPFE